MRSAGEVQKANEHRKAVAVVLQRKNGTVFFEQIISVP